MTTTFFKYDYTKCGRCGGSNTVLGIGMYNYEPCPVCNPIEHTAHQEQQTALKTSKIADKSTKGQP